MKTIKISEATPLQLNWLVAKCEGYRPEHCADTIFVGGDYHEEGYSPTADWSQMGPIIDRCPEMQFWPWGGSVDERNGELQCACLPVQLEGATRMRTWFGKTKLIAAARCYVASKLGEVVEVPEELT
jgi:hypothetical protein